ncbi:MAG TPA: FKBP-type peptidyl-prolyl cis-trans isomerase, partial [Solirubrobacterales bacterium]|nr:FKBP-type peptidyl-prolyl cis-trans isomerase [Solirubrobacterales bacterium]
LLVSCGGGDSSEPDSSSVPPQGNEGRSDATGSEGSAPSKLEVDTSMRSVKGTGPKPKLRYPRKPPRHVVSRVLKVGSGPAVTPGEELAARYVGGNPKTKLVQDFWNERDPYRFRLGSNTLGKAWVIGLRGMKLGGRRELIVPSRLAYGDGMMVYVIELLAMEKRKTDRAR